MAANSHTQASDIQDVKCQEAAASNSLRKKPQIWILQVLQDLLS